MGLTDLKAVSRSIPIFDTKPPLYRKRDLKIGIERASSRRSLKSISHKSSKSVSGSRTYMKSFIAKLFQPSNNSPYKSNIKRISSEKRDSKSPLEIK